MNNNLFFFILSASLLVLSVVTICLAPIINGADQDNYFTHWRDSNCKKRDDDYKFEKSKEHSIYENDEPLEDQDKRRINECKQHKVMYGLEYAAFVVDITFGFICTVLGSIHYLEPGKPFEKYSGLIGLIMGAISAIITIIYIGFSANIFSNEPIRSITKLYPNKASLHYNGVSYIYDYDSEKLKDDYDIKFIRYKDLGKKQYNYDSEIYQLGLYPNDASKNNEFKGCQRADLTNLNNPETYTDSFSKTVDCEYIWNNVENSSTANKFLHDRWITTIIFGVFITVIAIGLLIFGFLLFKGSGESTSPNQIPQSS